MTTLNPDTDEFILTPCIYRERQYAPLDRKEAERRKVAVNPKQSKGEPMEKQVGEYRCTKCGETVILPVGDDTLFKCKKCGGEECELNFTLNGQSE